MVAVCESIGDAAQQKNKTATVSLHTCWQGARAQEELKGKASDAEIKPQGKR